MKIIYPDYNNCLVNVSSSLLKYYGIEPNHNSLKELDKYLEKDYKNVVLILYDGFGSNLLTKNLGKESFLFKNKIKDITSVFPATTTSATTSLITGLTPIEHCWLGWNIYIKSIDKTVTMYWNVEKGTDKKVADYSICKKEFPYISIMDKINKTNNAKAYCISPYEGINYDIEELDDMYSKINELCKNNERKFIYVYCNQPDHIMHDLGVDDIKVTETMKMLNQKTEQLCEKLEDTLIIIIADHGHITAGDYIVLDNYPKLKDMLVRETSLEPRATNFFVKEGMLEDFKNEFNKLFSNDFILLSKKEVLDKKLFGSGIPHKKFDSCLGDYLALPITDKVIVDVHDEDPLKGIHGGISEEEVLIPLIVVDKKII